jgi:CrcB protein
MDTTARFLPWTLLAVAGAAGTLARAGTYLLVNQTRLGAVSSPAMATLIVNVLGSLAFGVIWTLASEHARLSDQTKWLLLTGFMGAYTTFSTFAFESGRMMTDGKLALALVNIAASNVLGIGAFLLGWWITRTVAA